jgi:hypothetical protein
MTRQISLLAPTNTFVDICSHGRLHEICLCIETQEPDQQVTPRRIHHQLEPLLRLRRPPSVCERLCSLVLILRYTSDVLPSCLHHRLHQEMTMYGPQMSIELLVEKMG